MKQKIIKSLLFLMISQMHVFASAQESNTIQPASIEVEEGAAEAELNVYMSNSISMCGYEFYLQLPAGVSVKQGFDEEEEEDIIYAFNGGRARTSHVLSCTDRGDGSYYIFCYEPENKNFYDSDTKKSLPLCTLTLSLASTVKAGTYDIVIEDIIMNHNNTEVNPNVIEEYKTASEKSTLTVKSGNFKAVDAGDNAVSRYVREGDDVTIQDTYKSLSVTDNVDGVNISYYRTFNNTNAQALYLPYSLDIATDLADFEVYAISSAEDGKVHVSPLTTGSTSANTPYVILAKTTGVKTISVSGANLKATDETPMDLGDFYIAGTYSTVEYGDIEGDWYALRGGQFMKAGEGAYLSPFRFYLKPKSASSVKESLEIVVNGDATGISSVAGGEYTGESIYNIAGQNVGKDYKGIVIRNNKKILQR